MDRTTYADLLQLQMYAISNEIRELSWLGIHAHYSRSNRRVRLVRGSKEIGDDTYGKELALRVGMKLNPDLSQVVIYWPYLHKLAFTGMGLDSARTYDLGDEEDLKVLKWT